MAKESEKINIENITVKTCIKLECIYKNKLKPKSNIKPNLRG